MEKIPKDLLRWLKDNKRYTEFKRLITICGYKVSDLTGAFYENNKGEKTYNIQKWLETSNEDKWVDIKDENGITKMSMPYIVFLDKLGLNWRK